MSTAICDVMGTSQQIANMFIHCSWCNEHFSVKVLQHIRVGIIRAHIHEELTHTHWKKRKQGPNFLSPSILVQILYADLHTFP